MPAKTKEVCTFQQLAVCKQETVKETLYVLRVVWSETKRVFIYLFSYIFFLVSKKFNFNSLNLGVVLAIILDNVKIP
jgi:hypothetical protein